MWISALKHAMPVFCGGGVGEGEGTELAGHH